MLLRFLLLSQAVVSHDGPCALTACWERLAALLFVLLFCVVAFEGARDWRATCSHDSPAYNKTVSYGLLIFH